VLAALFAAPVVPVHAEADGARLIRLADACHAGGVRAFEATDRLPGALEAFAALAAHRDRALPDLVLGIGSVEEPAVAAAYVAAGADFVVAPFVDEDLAAWCVAAGVLHVPGAVTPTEVRRARRSGARLVKLFPAGTVGPAHLAHLRGPDRTTRFMPTGGLAADAATLAAWARAGASCVGLGSGLIGAGADDPAAAAALTARCAAALEAVRAVRPVDVATP
jgi:2-dehydro-3-deoxyphosphogluconate aldolase/(4S)-4-hydroxy-2-oxoglutarate aldolase